MKNRLSAARIAGIRSAGLLGVVLAIGVTLAVWKSGVARSAEAAAANQPEPVEVVTEAVASQRQHRGTTTSIGTVLATRSVTLRNELPGTVRSTGLAPGRIVEAGTVLVALDVSVEEAELAALQAQAELAETTLARLQRMYDRRAVSAIELDNARAEHEVALARIDRTRAIIERKTIRAPFRARVGISDVHPGQFLEAGSLLTSLQGIDDAANVDFDVAQAVAAGLTPGDEVLILPGESDRAGIPGRIVAVDARVDPTTRNAAVRARIEGRGAELSPGASVRVLVPVGEAQTAVGVPVNALRRGPGGDHVFVIEAADGGESRVYQRLVETGPVVGDEVIILAGLRPGERVAASGSFKLREAALVQVATDAVTTASAR